MVNRPKKYVLLATWSIVVGIKRNAEQTALLDLFLAGMTSVMVTIRTCASPHIPTVIIKSISVLLLLHGAALLSCSYSNSLFVDYWQDTGTCQQHVREAAFAVSGKSPQGLTFPSLSLSFFLSSSRCLWGGPSGDNFKLSADKRFPDWDVFFSSPPIQNDMSDATNSLLKRHCLDFLKHENQMIHPSESPTFIQMWLYREKEQLK